MTCRRCGWCWGGAISLANKTPDLVLWLCAHGVMPLYTPVGGSWLNRAESIERGLKRRALDGQPPHRPAEIGTWFEQTAQSWNKKPTPFVWNGKRRPRRRSGGEPMHRVPARGAAAAARATLGPAPQEG